MEAAAAGAALVRLVVGVLGPCVALLCLLNGLLLLRLSWRRARRAGPCRGPRGRAAGGAPDAWLSASPAAPPAPPNSPAGSWTAAAAAATPEGAAGRPGGGPRRKGPGGRAAPPFEYGSSIRRSDGGARLDSAQFSASQGPGLDSDFGASAGVSLRILSSDSEESPAAAAARRQPRQAGRFEWDYYDPGYARGAPLPPHLPGLCSKQYWL